MVAVMQPAAALDVAMVTLLTPCREALPGGIEDAFDGPRCMVA